MRTRLLAMMFLQYAIWGAWAPVLWPHLTGPLGMTHTQAGWVFGALWLGCMVAPLAGGHLADRWFPTQTFLGVAHLAGGGLLLALGLLPSTPGRAFWTWMPPMVGYALLYAPTLALTNSLALTHLGSDREFGRVRVGGTVGWIVAGLLLTVWRRSGLVAIPGGCDSIVLAGAFSLLMGLYCFTLPPTAPTRRAPEPLALYRALSVLRDKNTLAFVLIALAVTTELQFYYGPTASFLEGAMGVEHADVPMTMSVAQVAEILAMALALPVALSRLGLRKTLALGVVAWPLRYLVFAVAPLGPLAITRPMVIASLTLHGIGFTFFFVASQIFIDRVAPRDARASAQGLLTFVTLGIGNFLGTLFTGTVLEHFTVGQGSSASVQWTAVFLVPCAITVACALAFLLFVRDVRSGVVAKPLAEHAPA